MKILSNVLVLILSIFPSTLAQLCNNFRIESGVCFKPGETRLSCNGAFLLAFQTDGNLVIYSNTSPQNVIWASYTQGKNAVKACMQTDGRFVIYDSANAALWFTSWFVSNTDTGAYATIEDNAVFAIYQGSTIMSYGSSKFVDNAVKTPTGNCMTNNSTRYTTFACFRLEFISGNLIVYQSLYPSQPIWNSKTSTLGAVRACVETDGRVVFYNSANSIINGTAITSWPGNNGQNAVAQNAADASVNGLSKEWTMVMSPGCADKLQIQMF